MKNTPFACSTCGHKIRVTAKNKSHQIKMACISCGKNRIFMPQKEEKKQNGSNTGYKMALTTNHNADHTKIIKNDILEKNAPLYKYMESEFAQKLINGGTLRIGTLHEFQNVEKHGSEIGDYEEGIKYIKNNPGEIYDYSVLGSVPKFAKNFIRAEEGQHVKIVGIQMEQKIVSPNYYLFCITSEICEEAMKAFGYDTIVEITDPKSFFQKLSVSLKKEAAVSETFDISPCNYRTRSNHYASSDRTHPAIIKDNKYSYQKEVRVIWTPQNGAIEPFILESKSAARYCRVVKEI